MKCLLIETKDKRKFFTYEKNFPQLIEFSKTFNAQMSIVQLDKGLILELEELAPAICNPEYQKSYSEYEVIEKKTKATNKRPNILNIAKSVSSFVFNEFQTKKSISLKTLKIKFKQYNLSDSALCNHIRRVKKQMESQGFKFIKIGAGEYECSI